MQICKIGPDKLHEALELVWQVFEKYEVPDYEEMGVQTFYRLSQYGGENQSGRNEILGMLSEKLSGGCHCTAGRTAYQSVVRAG